MLDALAERRPAFTIGAITALIALMNHPAARADSAASLRAIHSGGAPIAPAVVAAFEAKFGRYVRNAYGLTETTSPATVCPVHLRAPVDPAFGALSVGVPTYRTDIRIVDAETGRPLPPGEAGEITIRGPQVVAGYWNQPEATREAIRDGCRGETVKAVLRLKAGAEASAADIIEHCRARMAASKVPRVVLFIAGLPKTVTGKILRRELRGRSPDGRGRHGHRTRPVHFETAENHHKIHTNQ